MDITALFHALLLILSIPNKALNSLNSLLNAYPRTIGPPPPPPVITAIAYRYLTAVSTAYSFETHGTISPTCTAMPRYTAVRTTPSYFLTNAAPATSLYTESHESSELTVYEMPTARHLEYPIMINNAVYFWLLVLMVVCLASVWVNRRCEVYALRRRCSVYEALQRSVKEQNDDLMKEKLSALATISRVDIVLNMAVDDLTAAYGQIGTIENLHRERIDGLVKDKLTALATISRVDMVLDMAVDDLAAAYGQIGTIERAHSERIDGLMKDQGTALTTISLADKALNMAVEDIAAAYAEIGTIERAHREKVECLDLKCKTAEAAHETTKNARDEAEAGRDAAVIAKDAAIAAQSAAEISFKDLQDKFEEQAQAHRKEIQSAEAAQKDAQRGRDAAVDESRVAMAAVAAAEEARKAAEAGCKDFQDISKAQADEFERSRKNYEMRQTDFVEMESSATKQSVKIEELEEVIERLKYDAARRPETTQKFLTKALSLTARRTEAQVGELTVTVNDLQDACNAFAILLNDTLSKCEPIESRDVKERYDELMHQFQQRRNVSAAHQAPWDVLHGRHTVETATHASDDLISDGDGFAQTIATFSVDDSPTSTVAHSPCGVPVAVRLPPPAPPKVEADAGAMCSGVKSDDDGQVSDQCYDRDGETSSDGGESGYVSGSQRSSGSADTVSHHAPAESEQHETQVDSGGEASVATLRDPSLAALELRQESVLYSADTTYDNASASSEQHGDRIHGDGKVSIATSPDPSPASVEASLARTETTVEPGGSDLGDEYGSSDGFAASQIMDAGLDVKKKKTRRGHRGGTDRLHETIEEGIARRAGLEKPIRRGLGLSCWAPDYVKDANIEGDRHTDE
ncbi:hypothetical protein LTR17_021309 [Elasticomyces elasticus]|nr:hypothetical protein LTR17_021309 [Elasticomyces elasticus]